MESWLKLYAEFAFDPKVQSLSEANQRRLVMLFCLTKAEMVPGLSDDEIAKGMSISRRELEKTKVMFIAKHFIDDSWQLCNWHKRQRGMSDSLERTQRYRDRQRNGPVTSHERHGDVTDTSRVTIAPARLDKTREEKRNTNTTPSRAASMQATATPRARAPHARRARGVDPDAEIHPIIRDRDADEIAAIRERERKELNGEPQAPDDDRTEDLKREAIAKLHASTREPE